MLEMNCIEQKWLECFSAQELEKIYKICQLDRANPLQRLIFCEDDISPNKTLLDTQRHTIDSLCFVREEKSSWFTKKKKELIGSLKDFENNSALLGEFRCFGDLLISKSRFFARHPHQLLVNEIQVVKGKKTPDFELIYQKNSAFVEVVTKQMNGQQRETLVKDLVTPSAASASNKGKRIEVRERVVSPLGAGIANYIHFLASIKQESKQFDKSASNILWVDMQDEVWNMHERILSTTQPFYAYRGAGCIGIMSSPLWYAMYGWKGAPLFQYCQLEQMAQYKPCFMEHDGLFTYNKNISAAVFSFSNKLIVLENPFAIISLPKWLREFILFLPRYNFCESKIQWPNNDLRRIISIEKRKIIQLQKQKLYGM